MKLKLFLLLLLCTGDAHDGITAGELRQHCLRLVEFESGGNRVTAAENALDAGVCSGFVHAILSLEIAINDSASSLFRFCQPATGATVSEAATIFLEYATEHPGQLEQPGLLQLLRSLHQAWPCTSKIDTRTKKIQVRLTALGYDPGPADGVMGSKTRQAIREFQRARRLRVDGKVSQRLVTELIQALGE